VRHFAALELVAVRQRAEVAYVDDTDFIEGVQLAGEGDFDW
jgi:hypothetical protein